MFIYHYKGFHNPMHIGFLICLPARKSRRTYLLYNSFAFQKLYLLQIHKAYINNNIDEYDNKKP